MFRTTRHASILMLVLASVPVACDVLEVRDSNQGPTWQEVVDATAPHLMREYDSAELRLDPGVAPVGSYDELRPAPDEEREERERVAREAGFQLASWKDEMDYWHEGPAAVCDEVVVAYSEPELENPADERWTVQAWIVDKGTTNVAFFDLDRARDGWTVSNMTTGPLDIY